MGGCSVSTRSQRSISVVKKTSIIANFAWVSECWIGKILKTLNIL
ncbi:hypothetical protein M595_4968 [Lyngbya aestuarii BL J]|uniref:Uncharacterized protein n=1 Tax=Lyngbya aestuarii BL J TaxID=1348334 RepID=U7QCZ9_9CYAN|nr:hypothetical protein M595_4968 [Lyngbya aestuarii BL J]